MNMKSALELYGWIEIQRLKQWCVNKNIKCFFYSWRNINVHTHVQRRMVYFTTTRVVSLCTGYALDEAPPPSPPPGPHIRAPRGPVRRQRSPETLWGPLTDVRVVRLYPAICESSWTRESIVKIIFCTFSVPDFTPCLNYSTISNRFQKSTSKVDKTSCMLRLNSTN